MILTRTINTAENVPVTAVQSTALAGVAYDDSSAVLRLEFRNHSIYCYYGVPQQIYRDFLASESKGSYFNRNIRGRYPFQQFR